MNSATIYAQSDPQAYGSPFWIWSSTIATNFIACKKDAKNGIIFVSGRSIFLKEIKKDSTHIYFGQWILQRPVWAVDSTTQCRNFRISLPLRFHECWPQKLPF